jgi:hypothetical protein
MRQYFREVIQILRKGLFFIPAVFLFAIMMMLAACIRIATPATPAPTAPTGNQPPIISSLTAAQNQTYPGGTVNVQGIASDPNGDSLNYKWTATGGSFVESGRGNNTWRAPNDFGDYDIKLTVDDGKGGTAEATVKIMVSANHPPTINSLTANPPSLQFAAKTTLTAVASDQDGDPVQFKWDASGGTLSGVGNKVTWTSPSKNGNYIITVTVSDGKGGETRQDITIPVAAPTGVQTLNMVKQESGTVGSDGNRDASIYKAGDDEKNLGYRAFFSYNIFPLQGMDIKQARLIFSGTRVVGDDPFDPTTGVGGFQLRHLSYGGQMPPFGTMDGGPVERDQSYQNKAMDVVDVTPELINDVSNRLERSQFEAGFMKRTTNGNNIAQYIQWTDVALEVTASAK